MRRLFSVLNKTLDSSEVSRKYDRPFKNGNGLIYLDHNATTPLHPAVKSKMDEYALLPLNPSSIHSSGRAATSIIENSRKLIARLMGFEGNFKNYRVTFTSGGTEANNIILANYRDGEIFISATEHTSIWAHSKVASNFTVIQVDRNGVLDLEYLQQKLANSTKQKKLVSVMLANNETGIISPIQKITKIAHEYGAEIHSDCVQAAGKIPIDIMDIDLDFASISGHKFSGPAGAGVLISKTSFHLQPIFIGGGQERGLRSGTENVPAIAGLGQAALIAFDELDKRIDHMKKLRDRLESRLLNRFSDVRFPGINTDRLPNTSLIINPRTTAQIMLIALDLKGVAVSSGSACSSGKVGKSHVLSAMGYSDDEVKSAIRISVGYTTTNKDIDDFLEIYSELDK